MTKVKEIRTIKSGKKAKITVKSLIGEVRKKLNKERVEAVMSLLEEKYKDLDAAQRVVKKIEAQISKIENKDIEEIDVDDYSGNYEYDEDDDE